jgi:hypothetical protein
MTKKVRLTEEHDDNGLVNHKTASNTYPFDDSVASFATIDSLMFVEGNGSGCSGMRSFLPRVRGAMVEVADCSVDPRK